MKNRLLLVVMSVIFLSCQTNVEEPSIQPQQLSEGTEVHYIVELSNGQLEKVSSVSLSEDFDSDAIEIIADKHFSEYSDMTHINGVEIIGSTIMTGSMVKNGEQPLSYNPFMHGAYNDACRACAGFSVPGWYAYNRCDQGLYNICTAYNVSNGIGFHINCATMQVN